MSDPNVLPPSPYSSSAERVEPPETDLPPAQYRAYPGHEVPPVPPASGATAITAGILALLGAIAHTAFLIIQLGNLDMVTSSGLTTLQMIANTLLVVVLLPGGILLLSRRPSGRLLVVSASGFATLYFIGIGVALVGPLSDAAAAQSADASVGAVPGVASAMVFLMCVPALTAFVLSVVPPTGRWIHQRGGH